jgi:RNA polymerase sigma-70 factor (ECF subfamily)
LLTSPSDVDEVLQETSIILWSKFGEFRQSESFLNWACGVAHLEVLRFYRQNRRRLLPLEEPVMEQLMAARREQSSRSDHRRAALATCLTALRVEDRELIQRCYEQGAAFKDVAEQMGRPVNSVYKSLGRVRRWLHECINRKLSAEAHL